MEDSLQVLFPVEDSLHDDAGPPPPPAARSGPAATESPLSGPPSLRGGSEPISSAPSLQFAGGGRSSPGDAQDSSYPKLEISGTRTRDRDW